MRSVILISILLFLSTLVQAQTWQQLDSLGQALTKQQKFQEADSVLQIALKKVEAQYGKDVSYASVLMNLGFVFYHSGLHKKVEPLWLEAKQIREKYLTKKHSEYIKSCNSLAGLYHVQGLYEKAEVLYTEAKNIVEEIFNKKHELYISSCSNLAILYNHQGFYAKAEIHYKEALQIAESLLGKKHAMYAAICNSLAICYYEQGFYDQAELLYIESKNAREDIFSKKHINYISSCSNLAVLYQEQGLYHKAEPLFLESKALTEEILGKKHPAYASVCNNLAVSYQEQGFYDKAEPLYLNTKTLNEENWGKKHPEYASVCTNLANLYGRLGIYEKAEPLFLEAKAIEEEVLGKEHPAYAVDCSNLANLYKNQQLYDKAESLLLESIRIHETIFGKNHPDYANTSNHLGRLYHQQGLYDKAEPIFLDVVANKRNQIQVLLPSFSEKEKYAYWQSILCYFESFTQFCESYGNQKPAIMADLYDQTIFTKGIIFSSTQKMKNAILSSGDTLLVNQYNNWKQQRETYTKLYQLPLEEQKMQNLDLDDMKNQINDLERDLSKKSALFGQNVQTKSYKWQEVKTKLAKNEVVIEIIKSDSAYIALFLTAQTENYPAFYLFKNAQELEDKFLKYYKNCIEFKIEDTVSYNAFWKPIADKLLTLNKKGFKKIYLSPDGVFHQLSLNTLKNTKTGKFLLDEANIQLIGSSRDLIELNKKSRDLSQNYENYQAHLLGYPIYGTENSEPMKNRDRAAGFSGVQSAVGVAGSVSLLPGTKKEVENVFGLFNQKKLKVNLLLAENATEEALKNLKSPTILHVATHGFFIPEITDSEVQDMQTAMNRNLLKNPFMRSGLLLAGCQKPNPEGEDGILTAEEVMNLTLDNTELVVMSACETGLGDIQAGEGVFGLQRAFQQAGAKSVLMSLWKVDDEATQTLMTEFYTALLKGQSKRQAFKTAQMNLKKRFPEPYYWGAFVMVGE